MPRRDCPPSADPVEWQRVEWNYSCLSVFTKKQSEFRWEQKLQGNRKLPRAKSFQLLRCYSLIQIGQAGLTPHLMERSAKAKKNLSELSHLNLEVVLCCRSYHCKITSTKKIITGHCWGDAPASPGHCIHHCMQRERNKKDFIPHSVFKWTSSRVKGGIFLSLKTAKCSYTVVPSPSSHPVSSAEIVTGKTLCSPVTISLTVQEEVALHFPSLKRVVSMKLTCHLAFQVYLYLRHHGQQQQQQQQQRLQQEQTSFPAKSIEKVFHFNGWHWRCWGDCDEEDEKMMKMAMAMDDAEDAGCL